MTTINAYAAFEAGGELKPYQYDAGELGAHEVEIDVAYCGICHSDLSVIDSEWGNMDYPVVAGHEVVGTVAQVGNEVTSLSEGQTVGLGWHADYCSGCGECNSGDQNLCSQAQPTIIGHHGGFADKVRANAEAVVPIPDGIDLESAGPLFCGGGTVFNPMVQFQLQPTDRVAVIGIGGLGHMALKFLNAWGCDVTAFTSNKDKHDELIEMGAHHVLDSTDKSALKEATRRFDYIISTVNVNLDWNAYIKTLAPRGRLHFVGVTTDPLEIQITGMMSRQASLSSSPVASPATLATMLEFAKLHELRPIIETYKFSQINDAIKRLRSGDARYRVVLCRD